MDNNDEASVEVRLRSPIHAALVHVIGVTAPAIGADAAAIRLFRGAPQAGTDEAYILSPRGGAAAAAPSQAWPMTPGSVFGRLYDQGLSDGAFRISERLANTPSQDGALLGPLDPTRAANDAIAVAFVVREPTWCVAAYVRRERQAAFGPEAVAMLDRLKPTLKWVVLTGMQRATHVGLPPVSTEEPRRQRPTDALSRLSETERKVLDLLMMGMTERQAADQIGRSPHTVHVHVKNVYRKLDVTSRRQLRLIVDQALKV